MKIHGGVALLRHFSPTGYEPKKIELNRTLGVDVDEQLRKMLASPLYTEVSVKPDAESVQKREANAQRAQA